MIFFTKRHITACGVAASLLLGACSRDAMPTMEQQLVGRWEWQQTSGGASADLTPATTGHQMVVEFDRRGRARFYQDGSLMSAAAFTVRHNRGGFRQAGRHVILYRGYEGSQYYSISGNMLYLQEMNGKPARHSYIRLPSDHSFSTVLPGPM